MIKTDTIPNYPQMEALLTPRVQAESSLQALQPWCSQEFCFKTIMYVYKMCIHVWLISNGGISLLKANTDSLIANVTYLKDDCIGPQVGSMNIIVSNLFVVPWAI